MNVGIHNWIAATTRALPLALLLPAAAIAQDAGSGSPKRGLSAVRVDAAPTVDGEVRADPVWQHIEPSGDFIQTSPD